MKKEHDWIVFLAILALLYFLFKKKAAGEWEFPKIPNNKMITKQEESKKLYSPPSACASKG